MKKALLSVCLLLLTACSTTEIIQRPTRRKPKIETVEVDLPVFEKVDLEEEELFTVKQERVEDLDAEEVASILTAIQKTVRAKDILKLHSGEKESDLLLGSYAEITEPAGIAGAKVLLSPNNSSWKLEKGQNSLLFRSIYQGDYLLQWHDFHGQEHRMSLHNLLKYKFTEQENYAIITRSFEASNLENLNKAISLYRMAFPEGRHLGEAMQKLLVLAIKEGNKKRIQQCLNYWEERDFLSPEEESFLAEAKAMLAGDISGQEGQDPAYEEFQKFYEAGKRNLALRAYAEALEDYSKAMTMNQSYPETADLYAGIGKAYFAEENYAASVNYFRKALAKQTREEAELEGASLYYKLATAYKNLGKLREYRENLMLLRERYPKTLWGRKAYIELMRQN